MKRFLLFVLLCISFTYGFSQMFVKTGATVIKTMPKIGAGFDLDVGVKVATTEKYFKEAQLSVGILYDAINSSVMFNTKCGVLTKNRFTVYAGGALINVSTDDPRKARITYITGIEYNFKYDLITNSRLYCGVDLSQNNLFFKLGLKWNYYSIKKQLYTKNF